MELMKKYEAIIFYSIFAFTIGLSFGAYFQADADVEFISTALNSSAETHNLITDGENNYYYIEKYIPEQEYTYNESGFIIEKINGSD